MPYRTLSFAVFLHRLENLMRQDYARLSVRKRDMNLLLLSGILLKAALGLGDGAGAAAFALSFAEALIRAFTAAFPFFLMYKLRTDLGSADLKFAWLCGLLLPLFEAWGALLLACFWAALNNLPLHGKDAEARRPFAFLPYLGLSSLPFILRQIFIAGGN